MWLWVAEADVVSRELCSNDHLVAVLASGHPFADPGFGFFALVVVGGIYEVTAVVEEVIKHLKGLFLVAFAHHTFPGIAEIHGSET